MPIAKAQLLLQKHMVLNTDCNYAKKLASQYEIVPINKSQ